MSGVSNGNFDLGCADNLRGTRGPRPHGVRHRDADHNVKPGRELSGTVSMQPRKELELTVTTRLRQDAVNVIADRPNRDAGLFGDRRGG